MAAGQAARIASKAWATSASDMLAIVALTIGTLANIDFTVQQGEVLACFNLAIDSKIYLDLAERLINGDLAPFPMAHPPFFIVILSLILSAGGGSLIVVKLSLVAILSCTATLTWVSLRSADRSPIGGLAASFIIFSPLLQAYTCTVQYEIVAMALVTGAVFCTLRFLESSSTEYGNKLLVVSTGILWALAALTRETILLAAFTSLGVVACFGRLKAVWIGAAFVAVIGGWIVMQYMDHGVWVPISSKGAMNLRIGNNPLATGAFNLIGDTTILEPSGVAFILAHPWKFLGLVLGRTLYFFGIHRDGWSVAQPLAWQLYLALHGFVSLDLVRAVTRLVFPIAALAGVLCIPTLPPSLRRIGWLCALLVFSQWVVHAVMISSARFAIPIYPCLAILAAIAVTRLWRVVVILCPALLCGWVLAPSTLRATSDLAPPLWHGAAITRSDPTALTVKPGSLMNDGWVFPLEEYYGAGVIVFSGQVLDAATETQIATRLVLIDGSVACEQIMQLRGDEQFESICPIAETSTAQPQLKVISADIPVRFQWMKIERNPTSLRSASRTIGLEEKDAIFGSGFSGRETTPRGTAFHWMDRDRAAFMVWCEDKSDHLALKLRPYPRTPFAVQLRSNIGDTKEVIIDSAEWKEYRFSDIDLVRGWNVISLASEVSEQPCKKGDSHDCRHLSIGIVAPSCR